MPLRSSTPRTNAPRVVNPRVVGLHTRQETLASGVSQRHGV
jgi:hypothetical protein